MWGDIFKRVEIPNDLIDYVARYMHLCFNKDWPDPYRLLHVQDRVLLHLKNFISACEIPKDEIFENAVNEHFIEELEKFAEGNKANLQRLGNLNSTEYKDYLFAESTTFIRIILGSCYSNNQNIKLRTKADAQRRSKNKEIARQYELLKIQRAEEEQKKNQVRRGNRLRLEPLLNGLAEPLRCALAMHIKGCTYKEIGSVIFRHINSLDVRKQRSSSLIKEAQATIHNELGFIANHSVELDDSLFLDIIINRYKDQLELERRRLLDDRKNLDVNNTETKVYESLWHELIAENHRSREAMATQLTPALNARIRKEDMPAGTLEEKKELARWVNEQLEPLGLAVRCPKTGLPGKLWGIKGSYRPGKDGSFCIEVRKNGKNTKTAQFDTLPLLVITDSAPAPAPTSKPDSPVSISSEEPKKDWQQSVGTRETRSGQEIS